MNLLNTLARTAQPGIVREVCMGLNWTAVVAECDGELRCGLAATLNGRETCGTQPEIPRAGEMIGLSVADFFPWLAEDGSPRKSLAMAALNAALPPLTGEGDARNAVDVIAARGAGRRVALIGHFPFVDVLRQRVEQLDVIEQHPLDGDMPAEAAPAILPQADFIAMTGMTLMNGTFEGLMALCPPQAEIMLLGPSTPLSAVLFERGVNYLAGARVTDIPAVLRVVAQGGNFRQVRRAGVRLLIYRSG